MISFTRIQATDATFSASLLNRIQSAIEQAFSSVTGPFITGSVLSGVTVGTSQTQIAHKLGYTPSNIFLGCPSASSTIFQSKSADSKFIYLTASTACQLSVWVS